MLPLVEEGTRREGKGREERIRETVESWSKVERSLSLSLSEALAEPKLLCLFVRKIRRGRR